ncbi:histidine kinase dimerization/phospho-acceptor domain-containing protein [Gemmatimonas sp.]|uniref:histidine kinase dimerization/phospho-acceptor domain-containing protein n=1 Tax=Gemmatimonas sp. TaxID=1962908 RepID=UPI003564148F
MRHTKKAALGHGKESFNPRASALLRLTTSALARAPLRAELEALAEQLVPDKLTAFVVLKIEHSGDLVPVVARFSQRTADTAAVYWTSELRRRLTIATHNICLTTDDMPVLLLGTHLRDRDSPVGQLVLVAPRHCAPPGFRHPLMAEIATLLAECLVRESVRSPLGAVDKPLANCSRTNFRARCDATRAATSHEVRTPLSAILGLTKLLMEGVYGPVAARQLPVLLDIHASGHRRLDQLSAVSASSGRTFNEAAPGRSPAGPASDTGMDLRSSAAW